MIIEEIFKDVYNKGKSCCFTGYRPEKFPFILNSESVKYAELESKLINTVFSLSPGENCTFYTGMAMGFDIIAAEAVLLLKKSRLGDKIKLMCVLPYAGQGEGFPTDWKRRFDTVAECADGIITLSDKYEKGCYFRRNHYMVNNSDCVITWFDGKKGGTAETLAYAERRGRRIINLCDSYEGEFGGTGFSL